MGNFKAIVFDLDGTLVDSAPDLATAEAAAAEFTTLLERAGDLHLLSYAHLARGSMYHLHGRVPEALGAFRMVFQRDARELGKGFHLNERAVEIEDVVAFVGRHK